MTPAVAAVLADRPLVARLVLVAAPGATTGTCATPECEANHGIGRRFCEPCRDERRRESRRNWWANNGQSWREGRAA